MPYIGTSPSNGVRRKHTYTATAGQTSFSGAGAEGATLSYNDSNFVDVYQNGVKLSEADYTSTSGTAIVLAQGASVSDMIEIIVYDVFSVADTVSKADGGQFDGNVTMAGTLAVTGVLTANGGSVFNEGSADVDFRVESNGEANMLFVDGGNDRIYMGRNTTDGVGNARLQIEAQDGEAGVSIHRGSASTGGGKIFFSKSRAATAGDDTVVQSGDELGGLLFTGADGTDRASAAAQITVEVDGTPGSNDMPGRILFSTTADGASSVTERMRIDAAGAVHVATTSTNQANVGISLNANGNITAARDGGIVSLFNRKSDDGIISSFRKDGTEVGSIGTSGGATYYGGPASGIMFNGANINPTNGTATRVDNTNDIGISSYRFDDIFATNGTIQTSDRNEKQDIEELSDAEKRVAVVAKGLMRKFRWKDKVAEKGDDARTHFGIIAQDLQDAFTAESLDASKYAMFCSDTWWQKEITVDAVVADEANGIEAQDAYTYTDVKEEATTGYTEKTRLGVRYSELLAFIISAI